MNSPALHREQLYQLCGEFDGDITDKIQHALAVGTEYLDVPLGFLTRIEDDVQEIAYATGDHPKLQPGKSCPLDRAYCKATVEQEAPLAVQNAATAAEISDAAVETFGLGSYIGVKLMVDGDVFGTVCFGSYEPREQPFSEAEQLFVELTGQIIRTVYETAAQTEELTERTGRLEAEKQRFEDIAETSSDIIYRVDRTGEFTYVSSAVEDVLGYEPRELVGTSFAPLLREDSLPDAHEAFEAVLSGETLNGLVLKFVDASGETVLLEINATPVVENGEITGLQGVSRDITAWRAQERELRLKNQAIDNAEAGILIADARRPGYPLIYANSEMRQLVGDREDGLAGERLDSFLERISAPDSPGFPIERLDERDSFATELLTTDSKGLLFWSRIGATPVENERDVATHYLVSQTDITDAKRTEQVIRLLNRVLRHNLRNEMSVVIGYSQLLYHNSDEATRPFVEKIENASNRLVSLGQQARDLEQCARQERHPTRLDTRDLLTDIATTYRTRFPDVTIECDIAVDHDICAGPESQVALEELLQNAIKHNDRADPKVEITAENDGEWVVITVSDDGPGINQMEAAVVEKGEEKALEHSAGLGLWLTNWIVTRYGGSFHIRPDDNGNGTVATVRLPIVDPGESVEDAERRPTVLFT